VLLMRAATSAGGTATRYLTPAARRSMASRDERADAPISERMIWDALDEGRDPTVQTGAAASPPDDDPPPEPDTEGR
ncbi:MAG: Trp biosynthesis-associated membrane protein, partial [Mycobacterium sp.]